MSSNLERLDTAQETTPTARPLLRRTGPIRPPTIKASAPPTPELLPMRSFTAAPGALPRAHAADAPLGTRVAKGANTALEGFRTFRLAVWHGLRLGTTAVLLATLGAHLAIDAHFPSMALNALGNTPLAMWHSPDFLSGLSILGESLKENIPLLGQSAANIVITNPQADGLALTSGGMYLYDYARQKREQLRRFARRS